jgi:endosialidase-like protein
MNTKFICTIACACMCFTIINAQTNTFPTTGNVGIGTLAPATTLQVIGKSRFGATKNYAQFDEKGNLKFNGLSYYTLQDNQYAFRYANNINYGLFFNTSDIVSPIHKFWEFKDSTAATIISIDADDGTTKFKGGVSIGSVATPPPSKGLFVDGKVGIGIFAPDVPLHVHEGFGLTLGGGGDIVSGLITSYNLAIFQNKIQARNNKAADNLLLNQFGGNVGIGTTNPAVKLNVDGGTPLFDINRGGYIETGSKTAFNLVISESDIQARNNGAGSLLNLNKFGGDVNISRGALYVDATNNFVGIGAVPSVPLHVVLGTDASLTGGGYIVAGAIGANNVVIDAQGIQARVKSGFLPELFLNRDGGDVVTGGDLNVNGDILMESGSKFGGFEVINNFVTGSIGDFVAGSDNSDLLGNSSHRWLEVWSVDGSINTSDERDKTNIRNLNYGLKEIMKLHPIRFNWKNKTENGDKLGLIAQDLQKVLPEVVRDHEYKKIDSTGKTEKIPATRLGVMYADIIPVLVNGMQQQQKIIDEQNKKIEALTQLVNQLINKSSAVTNQTESEINAGDIISSALLQQNAPNPFNTNTMIRYSIPSTAKQSSLVITNTNGQTIKTFSINKKGAGQITIYANELAAGNYFYSLLVDGKKAATRKMVLTK